MTVLVTVLAAVVALLAVLVVGLLRSHAEILRALHELGADLDPDAPPSTTPRGANTLGSATVPRPRAEPLTAVDVAGRTPTGDAASVAIVGVSHATLLAFLTSGCSTCAEFWTAFADRRALDRVPGGARLVVVTKGEDGESPARLRRFVPPDVPVIMSSEAWTAYDVPVAPYFAYVEGDDGRIVGEGAAGSWDHLVGMMEQALSDAGIDAGGGRRRGRRAGGRERAEQIDRDLRRAGIEPGDPSLYPSSQADLHPQGSES